MSDTYTNNVGRSDYRLPTVNANDNGKVLKVVDGEWKKAEGGGSGGGLTLYGPYTAGVSSASSVSAGAVEYLPLDKITDSEDNRVYLPADGSGVYFFITQMGSLLQGLVTLYASAPMYFDADNTWADASMTVENISESAVDITKQDSPSVAFYSTAELSRVAPSPT